MRRSLDSDWHYIYVEDRNSELSVPSSAAAELGKDPHQQHLRSDHDRIINAAASRNLQWENPIELPAPHTRRLTPCDVDDPRIFHMFWTGDFADKPYLSVLSFLFTQNLGLHTSTPVECAPQLWLWINPVPAAKLSTPYTANELLDRLRSNKWAAPFFHPRFKDIIYFKLWDTAEQLDTLPELQKEWRSKKTLFNSDGQSIQMHQVQPSQDDETNIQNRAGTKSSDKYDILSVILSDMARFILCHRFGGIYLDADTLFLRDWEELWGWKGAFAYKWSVHEKYNTAVLRLRKQSVLGTFLLRTALKNGLDFHPFSLTTYLKEARMEGLLYRLPDALFDPAWLNMENVQRERPPQPFFTT
jgi:DDB1- and CUL4-associated factor 13